MLTREQTECIQNNFHIPVDSWCPDFYWIISIDRESVAPTTGELQQLQSYREYFIKRVYNKTYASKILEQALPKDAGHNTVIFRKGSIKSETENHWFFRRITWNYQWPVYIPDNMSHNYKGLTLVELLDKINDLFPEKWEQWKRQHDSIFQ